ncbi:MAG: NAD(P) transhydrogenase subunit alpha [Oscillospiraceae bacterium]|nr:NAD(P) transhydrogenase subunit alpha [Oscillospiraceae bacterium]
MIIGVPKEIMHDEYRVAAIPETVKKFVADGHTVRVERGAGVGAFFPDEAYAEAGAQLVDDVRDLFAKAALVLKVKEPLFNEKYGMHEVDMMHRGQFLITFIHPASPVNHEMVKKMAANGLIGLTLDGVPRISRAQNMDALTSMSTCAGYRGIVMAAEKLAKFIPNIFCAVGSIKPANVLVIGTGVAGLQAIATAKRLGAVTYAADIRSAAREQAASLGAKVVELGIPDEVAVADGGYANAITGEWLTKECDALREVISKMDIVFLSALVPGKLAPVMVTEDMVKSMAPGSVIVDIAIDQGGNCAITTPGEVEVKHGVTLMGVKNIPGFLPTSSTWMFAHNIYNLAKHLIKDDKVALDMSDPIDASILVTDGEKIVHKGALEAMGM